MTCDSQTLVLKSSTVMEELKSDGLNRKPRKEYGFTYRLMGGVLYLKEFHV